MVRAGIASAFMVLLWAAIPLAAHAEEGAPPQPHFEALDNALAWQVLDPAQTRLPAWARTLVRAMPRTTAAMLDLDYLHREENPLGKVLAAKLRWTVADAMQCDYFRKVSEYDLRQAGLSEEDIAAMPRPSDILSSDHEIIAQQFARQLTVAGRDVTDEQVRQLLKRFGPEHVVAIVHTIALANFQNRLALGLGLVEEPGGAAPALKPRWDRERLAKLAATPRQVPTQTPDAIGPADWLPPPRWDQGLALDVTSRLEDQKHRQLRIPLPDPGRLAALPPDAREQAEKVLWDRVSSGYQPVMTAGWFACHRPFKEESKLDRVFANSMFWVVTRENQCFY